MTDKTDTQSDAERARFNHADIERAGALIYRNASLLRTSLVSDKTEAFVHEIADALAEERERCARIAEAARWTCAVGDYHCDAPEKIADAIRRGE